MLCPNCGIKVGEEEARICPHCFQKMRTLQDLQRLGAKSVFTSTSQARAIRIKRRQIVADLSSFLLFSLTTFFFVTVLLLIAGLPRFDFSAFPSPSDEISSGSYVTYENEKIPVRSSVADYDYKQNKITLTFFSESLTQSQRQVWLTGEILYRVTEHQTAPDLEEIRNKPYVQVEMNFRPDTLKLTTTALKSFNIKFINFDASLSKKIISWKENYNQNDSAHSFVELDGIISVGNFISGRLTRNQNTKSKLTTHNPSNVGWDISFNTPLLVKYNTSTYLKSIVTGAQNFINKVRGIIG